MEHEHERAEDEEIATHFGDEDSFPISRRETRDAGETANAPESRATEFEFDPIVTLDVGGHKFKSRASVLRRAHYFRSLLSESFVEGRDLLQRENPKFFVDRNPMLFEEVLQRLRNPAARSRFVTPEMLRREAEELRFFGLDESLQGTSPTLPPERILSFGTESHPLLVGAKHVQIGLGIYPKFKALYFSLEKASDVENGGRAGYVGYALHRSVHNHVRANVLLASRSESDVERLVSTLFAGSPRRLIDRDQDRWFAYDEERVAALLLKCTVEIPVSDSVEASRNRGFGWVSDGKSFAFGSTYIPDAEHLRGRILRNEILN